VAETSAGQSATVSTTLLGTRNTATHDICGVAVRFLSITAGPEFPGPSLKDGRCLPTMPLCVSGVRRRNKRKASNSVFGTSTHQSMKFNVETLRQIPFFCGRTHGVSPVSFESHGRREGMRARVANRPARLSSRSRVCEGVKFDSTSEPAQAGTPLSR
jgi:hypothetical protein